MLTAALLLFLGLSSAFAAPAIDEERVCGTVISEPDRIAAESFFRANKVTPNATFVSTPIPIFFHVINTGPGLSNGDVPDSQIQAQIDVMNRDYAPTGLSWTLAGVDRTTNQDWFDNAGPQTFQQTQMKQQLRQGGVTTLNVYTVGFTSGDVKGLLGYSTFPSSFQGNPQDDGIVILFSSLPGGPIPGHTLGKTLTHEAGHWVGLYHTFQGGCFGDGDSVDDTPPEAKPTFKCPIGQSSCPGNGGDPIHNYMDYTDDDCKNNFTPGQVDRLTSQMATYRGFS